MGGLVARLGRLGDRSRRSADRLMNCLVDHIDEQFVVCSNCQGAWEDVQLVKYIPL